MIKIFCCVIVFLIASCSTVKKTNSVVEGTAKTGVSFQPFSRYGDTGVNYRILKAWQFYRSGKFRLSAEAFEKLIASGYNHYDICFGAGLSYMKYYDNSAALKYLEMTVSGNPQHFEAYYFMAQIKKHQKDFPGARGCLEKIIFTKFSGKVICGINEKDCLAYTDYEKRKNDSLTMLKQI